MPNDFSSDPHYDQIFVGYDAFFPPIADEIAAFAERHNLIIEKYCHDAPSWSLAFSHTNGGAAKIDLMMRSESSLTVDGIWWIDDYDASTRSIKRTDRIECERIPSVVAELIESTFKSLLSFQPEEWSQVATGYENFWKKTWTKEQFERLKDRYPAPKID